MQTPSSISAVPERPAGPLPGAAAEPRSVHVLRWIFGAALLLRLLFPFYNSPLGHLFSDPGRHWENGQRLFNPTFMGSGDPLLYQVWLYLLIQIKGNVAAVVSTGTGFLCAAMPYGWYRALKELLPKNWARGGALVIAAVPGFIGVYAYFMNETLLLSLTGFAFWATFRAQRKRTVAAFTLACALWLLAGFTRSVALPLALLCLLCIWLPQPRRVAKALIGVVLLLLVAVPAGLHGRVNLHYFAPFGNGYLNPIYQASGNKNINIELGPAGRYQFGSPSFYNPTFYPFSDWLTDRGDTVFITVDLSRGRAGWIAELKRVEQQPSLSTLRSYWENFLYLSFAQSWPDNDRAAVTGWLTVWTRWIWLPLVLVVAVGAVRGRFRGREWLLPLCGLGMFLYFMVQQEGVMEGRYRKPLDPIFIAAAVVMTYRSTRRGKPRLAAVEAPLVEAAAAVEAPIAGIPAAEALLAEGPTGEVPAQPPA
jgi:4-amino-4-deoxy-L-arabinose transferase-like glycosyltransferase